MLMNRILELSRGLEPPTSALPRRRATDCAKTAVQYEQDLMFKLLNNDMTNARYVY